VVLSSEQYTGAVAWKDASNTDLSATDTFTQGTVYTAAITLTAMPGYTFDGVAANAFTVDGLTATNTAGTSGDKTMAISVTFPAAKGDATWTSIFKTKDNFTTTTSLVPANDGEYLGPRAEVKRDSAKGELVFGRIDNGFTITTTGAGKLFSLQTGSAGGGSSWYAPTGVSSPVNIISGDDYKIVFTASVDAGTGGISFNAQDGKGFGDVVALSTTAKEITYTWTHGSGNFQMSTNNTTGVITILNMEVFHATY